MGFNSAFKGLISTNYIYDNQSKKQKKKNKIKIKKSLHGTTELQ
jgi:hypothetical protein